MKALGRSRQVFGRSEDCCVHENIAISPRLQTRATSHMQALHRVGALMTSSPWMSSSHPWVPAGHPQYTDARTRRGCGWPRFTDTHNHGTGAEYDHGNNHNTRVTRRATNPRTGGRRPKDRHDRSRQKQLFDCDTTDFGLCGRWMDSAFASAEKVACVRRLIVNGQDLETQAAMQSEDHSSSRGARTSIIVILEVTETDFPEDRPELPQ